MTERQRQLLLAIIEEFIDTANAVGSVSLYDKHKLNVSPATIRNEMSNLVKQGYLAKPHSSSGRIPTTLGLRMYVQELMQQLQDPDVVTQEEIKQQLHTSRFDKEELVRSGLKFLSETARNPAIALLGKEVYYSGLAEMLNVPEFQELEKLQGLLLVLEDYAALSEIFNRNKSDGDVKVLIGEETGLETFRDYAIVFSELRLYQGQGGYVAVIGPNRLAYEKTIPAVDFVAKSISQVVRGW